MHACLSTDRETEAWRGEVVTQVPPVTVPPLL